MAQSLRIFHIFFVVNIALLLVGVLLVRNVWRLIGDTLTGMTGIRLPWMPAIFALTFLFLLIGLFLVIQDITGIAAGVLHTENTLATVGLVVVLILSNVVIIRIVSRVGVIGYVPLVTEICRVLMQPRKDYFLPDLMRLSDGTEVTDSAIWKEKRRPQIRAIFENEVYGRIPDVNIAAEASLASIEEHVLQGEAIRKQVILSFRRGEKHVDLNLLMYIPARRDRPVPAFVGLNFYGNHTIHTDPGITISNTWIDSEQPFDDINGRKIAHSRGSRATHWPVERILQRGYALITMHSYDVDPDFDDGFQNGVHPLFYRQGQRRPDPGEWGSISAWAWGLGRIMDYLETDADIDHARIVLMGHSRLGKTALWAGAQDERFAIVISNDSGCMGAALSRRRYGETIADITAGFPHWFCGNFKKYANREDELPVDQHMLIALIAPRPVYIASARLDLWADPEGEFLSALAASGVYRLFGTDGLAADKQPGLHQPVMSTIGYHIRKGQHWVTPYDWDRFMDFADIHLKGE